MTALRHALNNRAAAQQRSSIAPGRSCLLQRKCACGGSAGLTGECEECNKKTLMRRADISRRGGVRESQSGTYILDPVPRSSGAPLDAATRAFFEPRFGRDFSRVRVHTDERAAQSARAVNALAYTLGDDVVFAAGRYAPETQAGRRLVAHELVHTIQQAPRLARQEGVIPAPPLDLGPGLARARQYQPRLRPHVPIAPTIAAPPIPVDSTAPMPSPCPNAAAVTTALQGSDVAAVTATEMARDISIARARSRTATPMSNSILQQAESAIRTEFGGLLPSGRNLLASGTVTTQTPAQFAQTRVPDAATAREHIAEAALHERADFLRGLCITDSSDATLQSVIGGAVLASRGMSFVRDYQSARIGGQTTFPTGQSPHVTVPSQNRNMGHIVVHEAMHFYVNDRYRATAEADSRRKKELMEGGAEFLARHVINQQLAQVPEFALNTGTYSSQFGYVARNLMGGGLATFEQAYFQGRVDLIGLPAQPKLAISQPGDALEREADALADEVLAKEEWPALPRLTKESSSGVVARQPNPQAPNAAPREAPAGAPNSAGAGVPSARTAPQIPTCSGTAVNQWISDPANPKVQLFGLTALSGAGATQPEFKVGAAPGGKGVVVLSTGAALSPIQMQFLAAGRYLDTTMINYRPDGTGEFPARPGGYRNVWDIDAGGSARLQAGEQEHCDDFRLAFYFSLFRFAEVVNDMAKQATVYTNETAARAALATNVKIDPANLVAYFQCLADWTRQERDKKKWHMPATPRAEFAYDPTVRDYVALRKLTAQALPQVGKHSSWDLLLNGAAPACMKHTTLTPSPPVTPSQQPSGAP
ncbi:MAG: hypothetical protein QOJ86_2333 [Bradyrhizobium sp.]|nr:hypothetical protein [Bradyrhizobium sp.]